MANKNAELIRYLENIIELEQTKYVWGEMIRRIDTTINQLGCPGWIKQEPVEKASFPEIVGGAASIVGVIGLIVGALVGLFSTGNIFQKAWNLIEKGIVFCIYGAVAGAVLGFIVFAIDKRRENISRKAAYQEYLDGKARDAKRVMSEKQQAERLKEVKKNLVRQQTCTDGLLHQYYSKNFIYSSYQNFAAVCSICEYLKSGKCDRLQGHEGAYVLYDNERRLERIVERLDDIAARLDQIKNTQYMLYNAIQEGNRVTERVLQEAYKQTQLQSFSAEQNAIAAYNSEIIAREANMSNWLKVYALHNLGM